MKLDVQIIKNLPVKQINTFEDRVIYNVAVETRELTKSLGAFPRLSGELERQEVAQPIAGSNKEYGLGSGVAYAKRVWNYNNVNWTNPNTMPKWYYNVFDKNSATILQNAVVKSLRSL